MMDDNVMNMYTSQASKASEFVQYDQGKLCLIHPKSAGSYSYRAVEWDQLEAKYCVILLDFIINIFYH